MCTELPTYGLYLRAAQASRPASLRHHVGRPSYYWERHLDFLRRHPGLAPPTYYLGYGDKYARRFEEELRPRLSPRGQRWGDRTLALLQARIEVLLEDDPGSFDALERDSAAFCAAAFQMHSRAYLDAGLAALQLSDALLLFLMPDTIDLFAPAAAHQAALTARVYWSRQGRDLRTKNHSSEKNQKRRLIWPRG